MPLPLIDDKEDTPLVYFQSVINRQDVPLEHFCAPRYRIPKVDADRIYFGAISASQMGQIQASQMMTDRFVVLDNLSQEDYQRIAEEIAKQRSWYHRIRRFLRG